MTAVLTSLALAMGASLELSLVMKATVIVGLALVAARCARSARASARHLLLVSAFGVLLAMPCVTLLLPPVAVQIPVSGSNYATYQTEPPVWAGQSPTANHSTGTSKPARGVANSWPAVSTANLLRAVWAMAAALFVAPVALALWRLRRLRRGALPWLMRPAFSRTLAAETGIKRPVDILLHEDIPGPVTCGVLYPAILLPLDVQEWTDDHLRQALVHELEHIRRGDWMVHVVTRAVCALYWFHPFVWIAWRRLSLESERACDDAVLRNAERDVYAEQLVMLARRMSARCAQPVLSMANRSDLSARVRAVLDLHQRRGRAGTFYATVTTVVAAVLALGISPLRTVAMVRGREALMSGAARPMFEAASIKPNKSAPGPMRLGIEPGGRFAATSVTLRMLLQFAYQIQQFQLSGGPSWLDSDRFDIVANAEGDAGDPFSADRQGRPNRLHLMVRALLADRFKLTLRHESRELPLYAFVVARSDGKLGAQLRPSTVDCGARLAHAGRGRDDVPSLGPLLPTRRPPCGLRVGMGTIAAGSVALSQLSNALSTWVNRMVVDQTGLTGTYDIDLHWTPHQLPHVLQERPPGAPPLPPLDPNGPSIFTAVQQQLGLKLDSQRGPVDVLVIDHVEQPTED